jgi:N utilization substance protein A
MNGDEVLRIVDAIHRDKNIDPEIVFQAIESAVELATTRHYGEESEVAVRVSRDDGTISGTINGEPLDPEETRGRIGAQTAKQIIIQKIREAERDSLYDEYDAEIGQMLTGVIQRYDGGTATVQLSNVEAILPRSEQIPGETHHNNERVRATVFEVKKQGTRVKVILSRTRPQLVQRLFEQEIPEIAEGGISVRAMAREPGYRSKVAVSSSDQRVDCVGACVGVRGNRIKNIVDELSGERIDIVRWDDDLQVLIPNALQPAEVEEVILCEMLGRAIVLVLEDQLSLAIGRRGQNVRLASKLSGWDIEIMTREELDDQIEQAMEGFMRLDGIEDSLAEGLVVEGYMSYDDLSVIEPDDLARMGGLTEEQVNHIVEQADARALEAEAAAQAERRRQREIAKIEAATKAAEGAEAKAAAEAAAAAGETADGEEEAAEGGEDSEVVTDGEQVSAEVTEAGDSDDESPAAETPVDETPVDETPVDETPVDDETPADETPADDSLAAETPDEVSEKAEASSKESSADSGS